MSTTGSFHARPVKTSPSKMRLTSRGKRVLVGIVAAPLLAGVIGVSMLMNAEGLGSTANAHNAEVAVSFETITVAHGESLWDVAVAIAPNADPRDVIVDLKRFNALTSSTVVPGQLLSLPPQYSAVQ